MYTFSHTLQGIIDFSENCYHAIKPKMSKTQFGKHSCNFFFRTLVPVLAPVFFAPCPYLYTVCPARFEALAIYQYQKKKKITLSLDTA
jgi:hypothetical protein